MNVKRIITQDYHRNGVGGAGGIITLFEAVGESGTMLAISIRPDRPDNPVYVRPGEDTRAAYIRAWLDDFARHTIVLNVEETARGNIAFAEGNSWRGGDTWGEEIAEHYRTNNNSEYGDPAAERYDEEHEPTVSVTVERS